MNECTVVPAYYAFKKKKHPSDNYYKWMRNFLKLNSYMMIYTGDQESASKILEMRKGLEDKTKVVVLPFEDLYCSRFMDYWKKDYERDHETYHDPALYIIWNEKTAFIKRAKESNPFGTSKSRIVLILRQFLPSLQALLEEPEFLRYIKAT